MIHARGLTRIFDRPGSEPLTAVDNLSLDVAPGEIFGFLGPNGAGKTTTIRMLTALIRPTRGEAVVNGFRLGEENEAIRRSVGLLTETPGMYDRLSAQYNLELFARLYEVSDPAGQVEKYLRMMGLWSRRGDPVGGFSKGMRQKLALARALLHEPRLVFLDEPTAGLDPEAAHMVREFIKEMRTQGRTVFLCTHNLDEADRLCDRIAVFKTRLLVVDTPANLRRRLYGRQIVFHLGEDAAPYLSVVQRFPFVQEAQAIDNKLVVRLDDPDRQNPNLVRALVQAGAAIQFVGELRYSLEDIYLKLVKQPAEK